MSSRHTTIVELGVVQGYLDLLDQQFQYGGEFSCGIFFLSQNRVVHLVDFLKECFDGGEGGQGLVRA